MAGFCASCLVLLFALVVLQACSGSTQPFAKSTKPAGRTAPPITVTQMNGLPPDKAQLMAKFLQETAAKRDVAIITQDFPDSWKLTGNFMPQNEVDGTIKVVYGWTLTDNKSQAVHQISGAEPAGPAVGDPWASVTPDTIRRIAGFTAENLSSRLAQMGYATQISGVIPPSHAFARAGPNAEKELDYETLYGTQVAAVSPGRPQTGSASVPEVDVEPVIVAERPEPRTDDVQPVPTSKQAKPAKTRAIRAVSVTGVKGSPGKGNAELAAAMRRVLKQAGWPVYKTARPDALTISGDVDLGQSNGSVQQVALAWTVTSPDGKVLGTIKQANNVQAGSLDAGWGKTADYAAQAGAEGIFGLVKKFR